MSTKAQGKYLGSKKVRIIHADSQAEITTSAPKDNAGDGLFFSPTDLVGVALGSCVITTIAIVAERSGLTDILSTFAVEKVMSADSPRRIETINLEIHLQTSLTEEIREKFERSGRSCPVHHSLKSDVNLTFIYDL